jgi:prevent-host-death family protein
MKTIGAYEAKTRLPRLLDEVEAGERITITKHGRPVAMLVPVQRPDRDQVGETIAALRRFRARHRLDGLSLREMIAEGRA